MNSVLWTARAQGELAAAWRTAIDASDLDRSPKRQQGRVGTVRIAVARIKDGCPC